jgi:type II secretory pathway predicted ATPase ExeA
MKNNPFNPTFGVEPTIFAGRADIIRQFLYGLESGIGDPNRAMMLSGPRGTGKTVVLQELASQAEQAGWISVKTVSSNNILTDIVEKLKVNAAEFLESDTNSAISNVSIGGVSVSRHFFEREKLSKSMQIRQLVSKINQKGVGVLFVVDEIKNNNGMREFAVLLQDLMSEKKEVALVAAGLPHEVSNVFHDKTISFLRRMRQYDLEPFSITESKITIKRTIENAKREIDDTALTIAAEICAGFPFLLQLVGYEIWEANVDNDWITLREAEVGINNAKKHMAKSIFDLIMQDISAKDREFLIAMCQDPNFSTTSIIAERLGVSKNYVSQYRLRLIKEGIIKEYEHGSVCLVIPVMRDYIIEKYL